MIVNWQQTAFEALVGAREAVTAAWIIYEGGQGSPVLNTQDGQLFAALRNAIDAKTKLDQFIRQAQRIG